MKIKLIVLTGPSGVGKNTIEKELFKDESLNIKISTSVTTRKPRKNEINKIHYNFISDKEFEKKIKENKFIEWNNHFSNKYGTLKSEINNIILEGKIPLIEVDVYGAKNIIKNYGNENIISIFVAPPSIEELKNRITLRNTETLEQIKERMSRVSEEMSYKTLFQNVIVNENIDQAVAKIKEIIRRKN